MLDFTQAFPFLFGRYKTKPIGANDHAGMQNTVGTNLTVGINRHIGMEYRTLANSHVGANLNPGSYLNAWMNVSTWINGSRAPMGMYATGIQRLGPCPVGIVHAKQTSCEAIWPLLISADDDGSSLGFCQVLRVSTLGKET